MQFKKPVLVRDFIKKALYDPDLGYFRNTQNIQLGNLAKPIPFNTLNGYGEYVQYL